jgi:biotin transporter BioY
MDVRQNVRNVDTWMRGLFIIIFGVIFYFLIGIVWLLVVFQFITKVITGGLNEQLEKFSIGLTQYVLQVLNYLTYQTEVRPFPFSPLPGAQGKS